MYGDSLPLDSTGLNPNDLPVYTGTDLLNGSTGQMAANPTSSFWSTAGSGLSSLFTTTADLAKSVAPAVVTGLVTASTPNPNAVVQAQQTTAQKMAAKSSSFMPWIIGGAIAAVLGVVAWLLLKRPKSKG